MISLDDLALDVAGQIAALVHLDTDAERTEQIARLVRDALAREWGRAEGLKEERDEARKLVEQMSQSCLLAEREQRAAESARQEAEAKAAALRDTATNLYNQLQALRYPDMSTLWRLGGRPLEDAFEALKASLISDAGRALLVELKIAQRLRRSFDLIATILEGIEQGTESEHVGLGMIRITVADALVKGGNREHTA